MGDEMVRVALSKQEWDFIAALRDIPPGQLKSLLDELLQRLVLFVQEPTCTQVQADGVPCATPTADCEQCVRVKGVLELLRRDLEQQ